MSTFSLLRRRFFESVPRFEFRRVLGVGGAGIVFEAWDRELNSEVAIKVLRGPHFVEGSGDYEEALSRFRRELALSRHLKHPGIVRLFDCGEADDGSPYFTMELIHGIDLRELLKRQGPRPLDEWSSLMKQVVSACAFAHGHGIVHRDLKPENVMVQGDGRVVILDFGLGRGLWMPQSTPHRQILGSFHYIAPETFSGRESDTRTDVYGLGVLMYELLAGRPPFDVSSPGDMALQHLRGPVPLAPLLVAGAPEPVVELILRCLEKKPLRRFADARALGEALRSATAEASLPEAVEAEQAEAGAPEPRRLVLSVDDDPLMRRILISLSEQSGCRGIGCGSGEEALAVLESRAVDLVLLDVVMPVMDGFDVLRVIRSDARFSRIPVVLVSAHDERQRRAFASEQGANGYLEKPIDPERVVRVIQQWAT